ncbi:Hypp6343 [Branchiostoma lanceolatum]|uniref:Hypp6343 protein n=1 Tax=Branchiostoma lanceolatum TaxID=7740 RepID=A0A8J9YTA3_BRALA|nr:Hypp6343 [Branchiostoma lanceolatum]
MGTSESKAEAKPGFMARLGCACVCPLKKRLSRKVLGEGGLSVVSESLTRRSPLPPGVRLVAPVRTQSDTPESEDSEISDISLEESLDSSTCSEESHTGGPVSPLSALDTHSKRRMVDADPTITGNTKSSTQGPARKRPNAVRLIQVAEAAKENGDNICLSGTPHYDSRSTGYVDWRGKEWNIY